jgi:hypothetical protein
MSERSLIEINQRLRWIHENKYKQEKAEAHYKKRATNPGRCPKHLLAKRLFPGHYR